MHRNSADHQGRLTQTPEYYSVNQAMEIAQWGRNKLYNLLNAGKIRSYKVGKQRLIDAASLHAFIRSCEVQNHHHK